MLPKAHFLFGAILATIFYFFGGISLFYALIILFSSVLIDIDHYLWYVKRKKDWSLKRAFYWHKGRKTNKPYFHIFHTLEFIIFILILSFVSEIFLFVFIGLIFHSILDFIEFLTKRKEDPFRELLLIRYFLSDKKNYS